MLPEPLATVVPAMLAIVGQTFVITSTWALGITGTFLGDYFGILMDQRVEGYVIFLLSPTTSFLLFLPRSVSGSDFRSMSSATQCM